MTMSVIKVTSGGLAVSKANTPYGYPCVLSTNGFGVAINVVTSGGLPIADATIGGGIFSGIQLSSSTFTVGSAQATAIGTLSVVGGTGTYTFSLTDSASNKVQVAGTNGVNLQVGATVATVGSFSITVTTTGGVPNFTQSFLITVLPSPPGNSGGANLPVVSGTTQVGFTLSTTNGTWTGNPTPTFTYQWQRMSSTTWNSSDIVSGALSNLNLKVTLSANGGVRGVDTLSSGKHYWEYTYTTIFNNFFNVGLALSSYTLGSGSTTGVAFVSRLGAFNINASNPGGTLGTINAGNVIGIAVDFAANLIWFRVAPSGNWNGSGAANPATGVGGFSISALSGSLYPYMGGGVNDACTANFGTSAFTGAVPSGFTPGWSLNAPVNIGTNANTYPLVTADIGSYIACTVTGTNAAGSASATSVAIGPVIAAAVGGATPTYEIYFF